MTLILTSKGSSNIPVELDGMTPSWAQDKSPKEIAQRKVLCGRQNVPLAELFTIEGDPTDQCIELHGKLDHVHYIGAGMQSGAISVHGDAGRHVGSRMRGGSLLIKGNVSDWLGAEMRGGEITVKGSAANGAGGAYCGSQKGMTGGTILITGSAGNEAGTKMRRGLIAVGCDAGDLLGHEMLAGTIFVQGTCGKNPGLGMRRGTLCLIGTAQPTLPPTFRYACTFRYTVHALLQRHLVSLGFPLRTNLRELFCDLHNGDCLSLGKGEIFTPVHE